VPVQSVKTNMRGEIGITFAVYPCKNIYWKNLKEANGAFFIRKIFYGKFAGVPVMIAG